MDQKKILVVDDDPIMLKVANFALARDYQTVTALSGDEAVRLFLREKPDMVLSDLMMPEMSGYELKQEIEDIAHAEVPFIFMTADDSDESESLGFESGAADYIRKPIKTNLLLKRVERIFRQVDEAKRLREAAEKDPMTGLLNKTASTELIREACAHSQGALLVIDLDNFKLVNDLYGHDMGDKVLIRFSELLISVIRKNDIAGRIGGDEFIIFCRNLLDEAAILNRVKFLNRGIGRFAKDCMGEDTDISLGCSAGAVFTDGDETDYDVLFSNADSCLYQVKQGGKHGCMIYREDMTSEDLQSSGDLDVFCRIMEERGPARGAWYAEKEQFQLIYRFLSRFISNYPWDVRLVMFEIICDDISENTAAVDRFCEISSANLRCSDVIMKYTDNRVVILLLHATEESFEVPVNRVMDAWAEEGMSGVRIAYESVPFTR